MTASASRLTWSQIYVDTAQVFARDAGVLCVLVLLFKGPTALESLLWHPRRIFGICDILAHAAWETLQFGAVTRVALFSLRNQRESIWKSLTVSFQEFWNLTVAGSILAFGTFVGLLCGVVPGLLVQVKYWPALVAVLDQRRGALEALAMAEELMKGHRWLVLGVQAFNLCVVAAQFFLFKRPFIQCSDWGPALARLLGGFTSTAFVITTAALYLRLKSAQSMAAPQVTRPAAFSPRLREAAVDSARYRGASC